MANTVTPATSSLASELLLNKIMNGQVQTSTGKTITAAGRAVSERLSSTAYELRTAEKNMAFGEAYVTAAQGEVTNLRDMLTSMKKNLVDVSSNSGANATDFKNAKIAAEQAFAQYSQALSGAKFNGKSLFTAAKLTLNAGNGVTMTVLGDALGGITTLKSRITTTLASATTQDKIQDLITAIDNAVGLLQGYEGKYSESVKALQNRQLLLADQGASLDGAAAAQSVAGMSGASNLLSGLLGDTQA